MPGDQGGNNLDCQNRRPLSISFPNLASGDVTMHTDSESNPSANRGTRVVLLQSTALVSSLYIFSFLKKRKKKVSQHYSLVSDCPGDLWLAFAGVVAEAAALVASRHPWTPGSTALVAGKGKRRPDSHSAHKPTTQYKVYLSNIIIFRPHIMVEENHDLCCVFFPNSAKSLPSSYHL